MPTSVPNLCDQKCYNYFLLSYSTRRTVYDAELDLLAIAQFLVVVVVLRMLPLWWRISRGRIDFLFCSSFVVSGPREPHHVSNVVGHTLFFVIKEPKNSRRVEDGTKQLDGPFLYNILHHIQSLWFFSVFFFSVRFQRFCQHMDNRTSFQLSVFIWIRPWHFIASSCTPPQNSMVDDCIVNAQKALGFWWRTYWLVNNYTQNFRGIFEVDSTTN